MALDMEWLKHTSMVQDDLLPTLWQQLIDELENFNPTPPQAVIETQQFTVHAATLGLTDTRLLSAAIINTLKRQGTDIVDANCFIKIHASSAANLKAYLNTLTSNDPKITLNNSYLRQTTNANQICFCGSLSSATLRPFMTSAATTLETPHSDNTLFVSLDIINNINDISSYIYFYLQGIYFDMSMIPAENLLTEEANNVSTD